MKSLLICLLLTILSFAQVTTAQNESVETSGFAQKQIESMFIQMDEKSLELQDRIVQKWAELRIKFGLTLIDLDLFDGIDVKAEYDYLADQSFKQGEFLRYDQWKLEGSINAGQIFEGADSPILVKLEKHQNVTFIRQFKTRKEARLALPYYYKHIPYNAQNAIDNLKEGDFVSIPLSMNLKLGGTGNFSPGILSADAYLAYLVKGNFILHFFRMPNNKLRMKVFAGKGKGVIGGTQGEFDYEIFGVDWADQVAEALLDYDLWDYKKSNTVGDLLVLDYIFDLNDETARAAFDAVLSPKMLLNDWQMIKSVFGDVPVTKQLLSDIEFVDRIAFEDKDKDEKRIERVFAAHNDFHLDQSKLTFNFLFVEWERLTTNLNNFVTSFTANDGKEYFYAPSYSRRHVFDLDLGFINFRVNNYRSFFTIYEGEPTKTDLNFTDLGVTHENREIFLSTGEQKDIMEELRWNLGDDVFDLIDWKNWIGKTRDEMVDRQNTRLYYQYFLNRDGISILRGYNRNQFHVRVRKLVGTPVFGAKFKKYKKYKKTLPVELLSKLNKMSKLLFEAISDESPLTDMEKSKKLMTLRSKFRFKKYGPLIMRTMLDNKSLQDYTYHHFILHAENANQIEFTYGKDDRKLYEQIRAIDNAVNQDDENSLKIFEGEF